MNKRSGNKSIPFLVELSRIIVGATFVFSGFVKAIDPLGFTYKIQDYLINFNLTELFSLALPMAILVVVAEFLLGAFLLLGIYRKWTTIFIGVFMLFFTPLTLWIALKNPVADCGCFGDALVITNWQTFYKNMVLSVCTVFLIIQWKRITPLFSAKMARFVGIFVAVFGILFALHNIYRLPVIDFRPYKIGVNIPGQTFVDPAKADVFETVFVYSKDGVEKEFTEENYPWNDSTWTFVDMKTRLVKAGIKPKIEDFAIETLFFDASIGGWATGGDVTDLIISDPSYSFLMIAYSLNKMNSSHLNSLKETYNYAKENGYAFYCLTSSSAEDVGRWEEQHKTGFQFCHADERVLKTMIRSNPGLMLLKNGTVINKWADNQIPGMSKLDVPLAESNIAKIKKKQTANGVSLLIIIFLFVAPLSVLKWLDK